MEEPNHFHIYMTGLDHLHIFMAEVDQVCLFVLTPLLAVLRYSAVFVQFMIHCMIFSMS